MVPLMLFIIRSFWRVGQGDRIREFVHLLGGWERRIGLAQWEIDGYMEELIEKLLRESGFL